MEPLWLCRDNFIRTSVRKVAGGTDNAFRRVVGGCPGVDLAAAIGEEERDLKAHPCDKCLYRSPLSGPGLGEPFSGGPQTGGERGRDYLGEIWSGASGSIN